ncbi:MAG: hypothetical protein Kow0075_00220 [Salibacteraceae bacterium]
MTVEIITPDRQIFNGEADAVQLPGINGSFGVLNNHAPLIAALRKGRVKITVGNDDTTFDIDGGVVEVKNNRVIVLAE